MQIVEKNTMLMKDIIHENSKNLLFENVAYISKNQINMILINKLKTKDYY